MPPASRTSALPPGVGSGLYGGSGAAAGKGRTPAVAPGARVRTAAEIRAAYGRPAVTMEATPCARGAGDVMALNREALEARGARLREMEERGAELEESAAGFAELARQLAGR
jgi:hypothetical protein